MAIELAAKSADEIAAEVVAEVERLDEQIEALVAERHKAKLVLAALQPERRT